MKSYKGIPESDLIDKCIAEDSSAQELLYKQFAGKMLAVCLRYARSRSDAEDILQDGFVKVFNHLKDFKREGSLEGWIRRIMVNTALRHYRNTQKYSDNVNIDYAEAELSEASDTISQMSAKEITGIIQQLPDGYRMVFNMYVVEGYIHKEIGEKLNISEGTSKSQLARARKYLMDVINKLGNK